MFAKLLTTSEGLGRTRRMSEFTMKKYPLVDSWMSSLKKNLNAPRLSEHPQSGGRDVKTRV